jgi:hypothetical protein
MPVVGDLIQAVKIDHWVKDVLGFSFVTTSALR